MSTTAFYQTQKELKEIQNDPATLKSLEFHAIHDHPKDFSTAEGIVMFQFVEIIVEDLPYENEYDGDVENLRQLMNELGSLGDETMLDWISVNVYVDRDLLGRVYDYYFERNS